MSSMIKLFLSNSIKFKSPEAEEGKNRACQVVYFDKTTPDSLSRWRNTPRKSMNPVLSQCQHIYAEVKFQEKVL